MILFVKDNAGVLFLVNVHTPISGIQIDGLHIVFAEPGEFIPLAEGYVLQGTTQLLSGVLDRDAEIDGRHIPAGTEISFGSLQIDLGGSILSDAVLSAVFFNGEIVITSGWTQFDSELSMQNMMRSDFFSGSSSFIPSVTYAKGVEV